MLVPPRMSCMHSVAIACSLLLSSCGGGGGGDAVPTSAATSVMPPRAVDLSDLQIAQQLYAGTSRTPTGFREEVKPAGHQYSSIVHLKNTDLDPSIAAPLPQYELCTDDWATALEWSEASTQAASQYAQLVASNDAAQYFEFGRTRAGDPDFYVQQRVFKCTYVNRSTADLRSPEGSAGQLNQRPLTSDELRLLAEYLWQFTRYNNYGNAVLKSSGASSTASLSHTLIIASLARAEAAGSCDRIDVAAWKHTADTTTGVLTLDIDVLWSFNARDTSGGALCQ